MIVVLIELEMQNTKEMSSLEREIRIEHSTRNIERSLVLIKRATKTLSFSNKSLEGTENTEEMIEEINDSKRFLDDAVRKLSKYEEKGGETRIPRMTCFMKRKRNIIQLKKN